MRGTVCLVVCAALLGAARVQAQTRFVRAEVDGLAAFDWGTGLLHFRTPPGDVRARSDSLVLRTAPRRDAPIDARFLCASQEGTWGYVLESREPLAANVLEYDYEIAGLPVDSVVTVDGTRWARVIVGARDSARRDVRRLWAAVDTARVALLDWAGYLPTREGVFARVPARARFAARPDGPPVASPFARRFDADDHWMEILDRRGAWLKVRFLQPAGACGDEPPADQVRRELWVRYLDARGRPTVWYYTRGC